MYPLQEKLSKSKCKEIWNFNFSYRKVSGSASAVFLVFMVTLPPVILVTGVISPATPYQQVRQRCEQHVGHHE